MDALGRALLSVAAASACCALAASCQPAPTNVPLRTFEGARRMDFLCMHVKDETSGVDVAPTPVPLETCAPTPPNTDGTTLPYHLYALVTQSLRGELAVVDLTAQRVVDQDRENPGVNFLPVGKLPVDVASTSDGRMSFVTSADPFKPAVYAIPSARILGDSQTLVGGSATANTLPSWPVCALPQKPGPIAVVPRADGYDVAVVLPGDAANAAKVVLIGAKAFEDPSALPPGQLVPCPISAAIELAEAVPSAFGPGAPWPDGVPYATVDSTMFKGASLLPRNASACSLTPPATYPLAPLPGSHAHASWAVQDGGFLFVADDGLPLVHVIDVSAPAALSELPPYVATSLANPDRVVSVSQIAVSPRTRDLKRYMYALDAKQGTVLVYDVTDPRSGPRSPMVRPHPELTPLQPRDRLAFSSPVASLAFARHDFPLTQVGSSPLQASRSGLLCNPSGSITTSTLTPQSSDTELGALYRVGENGGGLALGPKRLRGVFGLLTLSSGQVVTVDVDDWDAPCRRPAVLDGAAALALDAKGAALLSTELASQLAEPDRAGDPWGAPTAVGASGEGFFPVSAPHRVRSNVVLTDDPTTGQNIPSIVGVPQLLLGTKPVSGSDAAAAGYASLSVSLAGDDPTVHADQDWTFTYEGMLPGFNGVAATLDTEDGWRSLTFFQKAGAFCAHGVHDLALGQRTVAALQAEVDASNGALAMPPRAGDRTFDYVQLSDDLLPPGDSYWTNDSSPTPATCWTMPDGGRITSPVDRYNTCVQTFGTASAPTLARDLPVLEAYDGRLVTGRFLYGGSTPSTQSRIVAPRDTAGEASLKLVQCCFHAQAGFHVRASGQWLAVGAGVGYLHHVAPDSAAGRCVSSCDERLSLMNARGFDLTVQQAQSFKRDANSPFSIRNPLLAASFVAAAAPSQGLFTNEQRDLTYKLSTHGGFAIELVTLTSASSTAVSPQSMRYVSPLGQMGIVDGSTLGLILVDLNTLVVAKTYY